MPEYLSHAKLRLQETTIEDKEYSAIIIEKIIGDVPVGAFNEHHVSLYQKTRHAQGVKNRTINKELAYVFALLKWARREQKIETRKVDYQKLPEHRPIPIVLSPGEIARLLNEADPFHRALLLCLYSVGLRWSEARRLKWEDIDFENRALRCIQKGGSWKILPAPPALLAALEAIRGRSDSEYVFFTKRARGPITNMRKSLETARKKAGIQKRVYPHLLRHSLASHMVGAGVPTRTAQRALGHADIKMTEWYSQVAMQDLREAGEKIERSLQGEMNKNSGLQKRVSAGRKRKVNHRIK